MPPSAGLESRSVLCTHNDLQMKRLLLHATLSHFLIGVVILVLSILLGSTVTEAILAVWSLFCGVIGLCALLAFRSRVPYQGMTISFTKIWLQVYLAMTGMAVWLAVATVVHGAIVLGTGTHPVIKEIGYDTEAMNYVRASLSVWLIVMGTSTWLGIVLGLIAAVADIILIKKVVEALRCQPKELPAPVNVAQGFADAPPQYSNVGFSGSHFETENSAVVNPAPDYTSAMQLEVAPPSYEVAMTKAGELGFSAKPTIS